MDRFITKFCTWGQSAGYSSRALSVALRRLLPFLEERDAYRDIVYRHLDNPLTIDTAVETPSCWAYTSGDQLVLGAVSPSWRDLRSISKNEHVADLLSNFAHFASQYVLRSRIVRVQAGIALAHGVAFDFRPSHLHRMTVDATCNGIEAAHQEMQNSLAKPKIRHNRRCRELEAWVHIANPLDPFIHRALFQFWRATALAEASFWEDAFSALDGVTAVGTEALHHWQQLSAQPTRQGAGELLGMASDDVRDLEMLYKLRCAFGAHPPPTKWWDFAELYDNEETGRYFDIVRRFLYRLCSLERLTRRVEAEPQSWARWFHSNAELLFDVTWFAKLPY